MRYRVIAPIPFLDVPVAQGSPQLTKEADMSAISIPVASACISVLFLLGTLPAQTTGETGPPSEVSKVRIVRLSEVNGAVQLDRNTGRGYEAAMANLPIVEHSRLQTGMGVAEVEFEDNSTLRIAPGSIVEFPQLDRLPGGTTASSVRLVKGMAYVSLLKTRGNEFNLLFGQQKLQLPPASHIRLQVDGAQATLAVLDGTLRIDGPAGPADVPRKKTVTFHLQNPEAQLTVAKDVLPDALDSWDKDAAARHAQAGTLSAFSSPYAYGVGDMMYYGSFMNVGGCGSMWRPYFASAAWDPYSNGAWAWYQGAGYSWVSPYPWGWTPYHFGSWSYCSGAGWGWQPRGSWNGLNNATAVVSNGGPGRIPPRPIRPPGPGEPTLRAFSLKPVVRSEASADSFVFRRDSAGLGIPREGLGKLEKLSQSTVNRGTATTPIYFSAPSSATGNGRPTSEGIAAISLHRGSAPAPAAEMPSQPGSSSSGGGSSTRSGLQPSSQPPRSAAQPAGQAAPAAVPASGHPH
jgi:FecR protein